MQKIFYCFVLVIISLSLNSCKDDVTGADDNITKTPIKYNKVLSDQTHNVIMPLKVGNKWFYLINGDSTKLDSIVVVQEININGKQWFRTKMPDMVGAFLDTVKLTNTDTGLWIICDTCNYEFAPYPVPNSPVLYKQDLFVGNFQSTFYDSTIIKYYYNISENQSVSLFNQNTKAIKYESSSEGSNNYKGYWENLGKLHLGYTMNFIPDSGMINCEVYEFDKNYVKFNSKKIDLLNCIIVR